VWHGDFGQSWHDSARGQDGVVQQGDAWEKSEGKERWRKDLLN